MSFGEKIVSTFKTGWNSGNVCASELCGITASSLTSVIWGSLKCSILIKTFNIGMETQERKQ
ncbi:hypothetical protein MAR_016126, partial [Mya arenaria]